MSRLKKYWPSHEEVNRCIKREAETASDAVLLAVHQNTPLVFRNAGSDIEFERDENQLLESFLTKDLPSGNLLLAVTGKSGVGKSHIIRWLAAQLGRDPRAENMHVIRVPKSANLKAVVEAILEPLAGNEKYVETRKELHKAVSSVKPEEGAIRFSAELHVALNKKAETLKQTIQADLKAPNVRNLKFRLDHAIRLPNYFNDSALKIHFEQDVLPKIVERAILGRHEESDEEEKLPQFSVEDLRLHKNVDLGAAAAEVRKYFQTVLNREGGNGFELAVEVLNEVVDEAIRGVFRLDQALGGKTIEEVILDIREILLAEGKELVLLIEDFAGLSGIQEVLLSVCIQEAVRDGKTVRSPMRTAIAVTDGFLTNRDTILTRAKGEWIVQSALADDEDILARTVSLVGAYLNAARWGEEALKIKYNASLDNSSAGLTDWIETYKYEDETPEEADLREAFGTSREGIPLFPFNEKSIDFLAEAYLQEGSKLIYNPRKVIDNILRETLKFREEYLGGAFPSADLLGPQPKADIANWIHRTSVTSDDQKRLAKLIVLWGGNPNERTQLGSLPPMLFKCFNLPPPESLGIEPKKGDPKPAPKSPKPSMENPLTQIDDKFEADWDPRLEDWFGGSRLRQQYANKLRGAISSVLNRAVDWTALCMKPVEIKRIQISLPNAQGQEQLRAENALVFASDTEDPDGSHRRTALAFLRFEENREEWGYAKSDEDTILIANAVDRMLPAFIEQTAKKIQSDIRDLTEALARQGTLLGIAPKRVTTRSAIGEAIFSNAPEYAAISLEPGSPEYNWTEVCRAASEQRKGLQDLLRSKIAAFQGTTGSTAYAIDVSRLEIGSSDTFHQNSILNVDQKAHLSDLRTNRLKSRSNQLVKKLQIFQANVQSLFGIELDKDEVSASLKDLVRSAEEGKVWPGTEFKKKSLIEQIESFRSSAIGELMNHISELQGAANSTDSEEMFHTLGKIDLSLVAKTESFLGAITNFGNSVEAEVVQQETNFSGSDLGDSIVGIQNQLDSLERTFTELNAIEGTS
jgi:hypothetical protein